MKLSGRDAYALLTFMRMPAVVAFLEAQNVSRQTQSEPDYERDHAEEAQEEEARKQARAWIEKDPVLLARLRREFLAELEALADQMKREKEEVAEAR